jgi:hypothetical protein
LCWHRGGWCGHGTRWGGPVWGRRACSTLTPSRVPPLHSGFEPFGLGVPSEPQPWKHKWTPGRRPQPGKGDVRQPNEATHTPMHTPTLWVVPGNAVKHGGQLLGGVQAAPATAHSERLIDGALIPHPHDPRPGLGTTSRVPVWVTHLSTTEFTTILCMARWDLGTEAMRDASACTTVSKASGPPETAEWASPHSAARDPVKTSPVNIKVLALVGPRR